MHLARGLVGSAFKDLQACTFNQVLADGPILSTLDCLYLFPPPPPYNAFAHRWTHDGLFYDVWTPPFRAILIHTYTDATSSSQLVLFTTTAAAASNTRDGESVLLSKALLLRGPQASQRPWFRNYLIENEPRTSSVSAPNIEQTCQG